jgi:hypothetical protein
MPRGGLSSDPAKRERQLAVLEHGRLVAADRRAKGLPTKRRESREAPGGHRQNDSAGEPANDEPGTRIVPGGYEGGTRGRKPEPTQADGGTEGDDGGSGDDDGGGRELGGFTRFYARVLGHDV